MAENEPGIAGCNGPNSGSEAPKRGHLAQKDGLYSGAESKPSLSPALVAQYPALADTDSSALHHTEGQVTIAQPTKFDIASLVYCDPPTQKDFPPLALVSDSEQAAITGQHGQMSLAPEPGWPGTIWTASNYMSVGSMSSLSSCSTFSTLDASDLEAQGSLDALGPVVRPVLAQCSLDSLSSLVELFEARSSLDTFSDPASCLAPDLFLDPAISNGIFSFSDPIPNRPSTASSTHLPPQYIKCFGSPFDNSGSGEGKETGSPSKSKVNTEPLRHLVDKADSNLEPLKLEIDSHPETLSATITQQVYESCTKDLSLAKPIDSTPEPGKDLETSSPCTSAKRIKSPLSRCEEDTDWDESDSNYSDRSGVLTTLDYARKYQDDDFSSAQAPVKPLLTPAKQRLVDRIMQEFWIIFNQDYIGNVRSCTGFVSVSESGRASISDSTSNSSQDQNSPKFPRAGKRSREQGQEEDPDDGDPPGPKRLKKDVENLDKSTCKFACPYRKRNPRKYCVQGIWRPCALTPLESIARVKYEHLVENSIQVTANSGAGPICIDTIEYSNAGDAKRSLTTRRKLMSICRL
jgi:hypothetical protein